MNAASTGPIQAGIRPPHLSLASTSSQTIELAHYRDKVRVALVFLGDHARGGAVVEALDRSLVEFGNRRVQLLIVATGPLATAKDLLPPNGRVPVLTDGDGGVTESYGATGTASDVCAVLIDEAGIVSRVVTITGDDPADELLSVLDTASSHTM